MMGFSDTEITVSEDVGTVQVGLEVFQAPLVSPEFVNSGAGFGSDVFAIEGSASGIQMIVLFTVLTQSIDTIHMRYIPVVDRGTNILILCTAKSFNTVATDDFSTAGNLIVSLTFDALNNIFVIDPATFSVMIVDDNITEGNEDLFVSLTRLFTFSDIVIRSPNVSRLIIQDIGMTAFT